MRQIVRILAMLLNLSLFLFMSYIVVDSGLPSVLDDFPPWFVLVCLASIVNLMYISLSSRKDWSSLCFKRKTAEERKR